MVLSKEQEEKSKIIDKKSQVILEILKDISFLNINCILKQVSYEVEKAKNNSKL